jgi:hypothetical protein
MIVEVIANGNPYPYEVRHGLTTVREMKRTFSHCFLRTPAPEELEARDASGVLLHNDAVWEEDGGREERYYITLPAGYGG